MIHWNRMAKTSLEFLSPSTKRALYDITEELGLKDPRVFVRKAVEDKLLDLKRATFFRVSDRVAAGLRRRGIRPADLTKLFMT